MKVNHRYTTKQRRMIRVRKGVRGTAGRPRVSVFRSNQHLYVQVIDDEAQKTIAAVSDMKLAKKGTKSENAQKITEQLVGTLQKLKISRVVFDRGPYRYHGRVKVVAETLRNAGVQV